MYRANITAIAISFFTVIIAATGCTKNDSTTNASMVKGKFVLDELNVSAEMKRNPVDDSMWCYITYSYKYHFENEYGFMNMFKIIPDAKTGQVNNIDGIPSPPENFYSSPTDTLIEKENLSNKDSLNIQFEFKGALFKKVVDKYEVTGSFDEKILKRVMIKK